MCFHAGICHPGPAPLCHEAGWVGTQGSLCICGRHAHTDTVSNIVNLDTNMTLGHKIIFQRKLDVSTNQLPTSSVVLSEWGSTLPPQGTLSQWWGGGEQFGGCYWHPVDKEQERCKHPSMFRTIPLAKNYPAQNVRSAKTEKTWELNLASWISKICPQLLYHHWTSEEMWKGENSEWI